MLRRHIVEDSDIKDLCQKIYRNHKEALNLIFENKPDINYDIYSYLTELLKNENHIEPDHSSKSTIRFALKAWDHYDSQFKGNGWTDSGRILLFEFRNRPDSLTLHLVIGPGDENVREHLFNTAYKHNLKLSKAKLYPKWNSINLGSILNKKDFQKADFDYLRGVIEKKWEKQFNSKVNELLPTFNEAFEQLDTGNVLSK